MATSPTPHIPDHDLLCRIGRGSYGEVWLARSVTGAYRAVKIVHRHSFDHERPYDREFTGIKKFEPISRGSPTQVDILHVGRNDAEGFFFYVMELADDQRTGPQINPADYTPRTLRNEIYSRGQLPLAECLDIGVQLTTALEHLHGNGLIHRDIKPSNIVFVNGTPKLADVGLVTTLDATRSFVGTEGYIPLDGPGTPQADLYGLGKVLYEICTGRDRLDFPELPTDLKDHPEGKGLVQLNEVILKACEEDRKQRYQSAAVMRVDLLTLKAGRPLARRRPAFGWKSILGVILGLSVLTSGLIVGIRRGSSARPAVATRDSQTQTNPANNFQASTLDLPPVAPSNEIGTASGLAAWWKGEGNAQDSAGTNHGKLIEGVGFDVGRIGQAFSLNGTTALISVPNNPGWVFGKRDFSIALWASFSTTNGSQALLACEKSFGNVTKWVFCLHDGLLQWCMDGSQTPVWLGSAKFSPVSGQWYHLAITRSGDHFLFYINGIQVSAEIWSGEVPQPIAPLTIGNAWGGLCFKGLLDDIRIYNRALAPEEINTLTLADSSQSQKFDDVVEIGTRNYQRREFLINTSFEDVNSQVNLAVLANGDFLATWHQGLHWRCYGRVFNAQGAPVGSTFLLNPEDPSGWQWGPTPAPLPDGGFVVAWAGAKTMTAGVSTAQCFDSTRTPVGPQFALDLPDWTAVASHTNGDFVAVGTYAVGAKSNRDLPIYARRFNSAGTPYGPVFQVGLSTNGYATASAAYGTDGRFAFAWPSYTGNAMVRAYRSNEFSPFGAEFPANSIPQSAGSVRGLVSARYNSDNDLLVVWSGPAGAAFNSVYVRRYDSNMVAAGIEQQVNETAITYRWSTSLSIGPNNEALVCWDASTNIHARLLDGDGNPIGHEFRVNQFTQGSRSLGWEACLHTAVLGNSNLVVGWVGSGASGKGIYLTHLKFLTNAPTQSLASQ